jgi:hypothetical protein
VRRTCPARAEKGVVKRSRRRVSEQAEERKIVNGIILKLTFCTRGRINAVPPFDEEAIARAPNRYLCEGFPVAFEQGPKNVGLKFCFIPK